MGSRKSPFQTQRLIAFCVFTLVWIAVLVVVYYKHKCTLFPSKYTLKSTRDTQMTSLSVTLMTRLLTSSGDEIYISTNRWWYLLFSAQPLDILDNWSKSPTEFQFSVAVDPLRDVTKGYQPIEAFCCKHKWRITKRRIHSFSTHGKDGSLYYIGMMIVLSYY